MMIVRMLCALRLKCHFVGIIIGSKGIICGQSDKSTGHPCIGLLRSGTCETKSRWPLELPKACYFFLDEKVAQKSRFN
jgi:hypothetical protein